MKRTAITVILIFITCYVKAQYEVRLSSKVTAGTSVNVETYFFAEKLAVERIGHYVFDIKGTDYSHQPMVHFGFKHFSRYQDDPLIVRIAEILRQLRDTFHDNGPIMDHLLNQKDFPAVGARYVLKKTTPPDPKSGRLLAELTDSLRSFYIRADVAGFMKKHKAFYDGALKEVSKDIHARAFPYMEKWYGKSFPQYRLFISPAMPITPGDDNYRGFGPRIASSKGKIPSMVISSSKMLPLQNSLADYPQFGFDNPAVTSFLSFHEIRHSFVNPLVDKYADQINGDSILYTPELAKLLQPHYINDWYVSVVEHLVRLGEIRIAVSMKDHKEAERLRKLHIKEYKCVLIPLLETKIREYELNRKKHPDFESYVPELMKFLHSLSPQIIDEQAVKYGGGL
ncbi:DUF4932 domain-containing protein [Emticicia sp. CRIBPO]|uniref:DUF4932 domain-containing protein n=1 Tax=Emticicia sp. CRIBPO TaxID=2683258 RepID=UPI001412105D|nr:DUF4932 domain-containing protein [Emticicia sp. CRIBPO]NBA84405.1 DUF4932 domain-containing protein [Emticicia sp. CRIBPO]